MTVSQIWKTWRSRRAMTREFNTLDPAQREEIARDTGIDQATLKTIAAQGVYSDDELHRLMSLLGLDDVTIRRTHPAVYRDMSVVCSECIARRRCRSHLDHGSAGRAHRDYCPNTLTLGALQRENTVPALTV